MRSFAPALNSQNAQNRVQTLCSKDYDYTGGSPLLGGELSEAGGGSKVGKPLDKLGDKRVALIGTGATAIQCAPHLAKACKELYVFQRTPSSVDIRGNVATDPAEFRKIVRPGWQKDWMENFCATVNGQPTKEGDLVQDGWTDLMGRINKAVAALPRGERTGRGYGGGGYIN